MTLSSTAEGAHKQMETYLDQMVDFIIGFLKDQVNIRFDLYALFFKSANLYFRKKFKASKS